MFICVQITLRGDDTWDWEQTRVTMSINCCCCRWRWVKIIRALHHLFTLFSESALFFTADMMNACLTLKNSRKPDTPRCEHFHAAYYFAHNCCTISMIYPYWLAMVLTAWIYSIQLEFWSLQLHQHLRLHSTCYTHRDRQLDHVLPPSISSFQSAATPRRS